ncbi:MAG TPA: PPOX class F420-dependent oxidoreductase [Gaiellaceae bacterium]|nr:PPOX class F420-dependent oxidoreductase [Gaiellaceae bacterium]
MARLTEAEARLFEEPNYAVASTVRDDGCPQQTVVWIDYDGEHVLFNTAEGRYKAKYIRRTGRVGVHVIRSDDPYKWVAVAGPAELSHDGADEHIVKLAKKYLGVDSYPGRQEGEQRVIVRITPEHINSSGLDRRS